jgi:hypothetical protein
MSSRTKSPWNSLIRNWRFGTALVIADAPRAFSFEWVAATVPRKYQLHARVLLRGIIIIACLCDGPLPSYLFFRFSLLALLWTVEPKERVMPVRICCLACKSTYLVADEVRGKKIRCKDCSKPIAVPAANAAAPPVPLPEKRITPAKAQPQSISSGALPPKEIAIAPAEKPAGRSKMPLVLAGLGCLGALAVMLLLGGGVAAYLVLRSPEKAQPTNQSVEAKPERVPPPTVILWPKAQLLTLPLIGQRHFLE